MSASFRCYFYVLLHIFLRYYTIYPKKFRSNTLIFYCCCNKLVVIYYLTENTTSQFLNFIGLTSRCWQGCIPLRRLWGSESDLWPFPASRSCSHFLTCGSFLFSENRMAGGVYIIKFHIDSLFLFHTYNPCDSVGFTRSGRVIPFLKIRWSTTINHLQI